MSVYLTFLIRKYFGVREPHDGHRVEKINVGIWRHKSAFKSKWVLPNLLMVYVNPYGSMFSILEHFNDQQTSNEKIFSQMSYCYTFSSYHHAFERSTKPTESYYSIASSFPPNF